MIYFVNDHNGIELKNFLLQKCVENNIPATDIYPNSTSSDDYPLIAKLLVDKLKIKAIKFQQDILNFDSKKEICEQDLGIAICGSGQGMAMALNRFDWIRAGITTETKIATQIRNHNYANCLCLGAWEMDSNQAWQVLKAFIEAKCDYSDRHLRRVGQLSNLNSTSNLDI